MINHDKPGPEELYGQLMDLCSGENFFFKDIPVTDPSVVPGSKFYRIFNYRLCSYSSWLQPGALESRGIMFLVGSDGAMEKLVCRTPKKFFNLNENPFTLDVDMSDPIIVMAKEDGSIVSTYLDTDNQLKLKSKGSLSSQQALDAMAYLNRDENLGFKKDLYSVTYRGFTVNMEWVSPLNRIVVGYDQPELVVFSIIDNDNGNVLLDPSLMPYDYITERWVNDYAWDESKDGDLESFVKNSTGTEGVVAVSSSGLWVKIKSEWYQALHRTKDSINSDKALIATVLNEGSDDLKSMFFEDALAIKKIEAYETHISGFYNSWCCQVEDFITENKHLGRKEFAIYTKSYIDEGHGPKWLFSVLMSAYLEDGRDHETMIKDNINKNYQDFVLSEFGDKDECNE